MENKKLHSIKSTGFKTPNQYFESFDAKLKHRLAEKELINDIDTSGFEVPEHYFDSVDDKIIRKLKNDNAVITLKSRQSFYYFAGIAASLLLLFAIYINYESTDDISAEMVKTYFQDSELDSYELAQLLSDAELLEEDFIITETEYSEDNLEDYLLDNTDIEQLLQ